ncbi:MAG TPA: YdiU family protein [Conexibacter sp.]|nr:YdiU family protein [Conexibacter sp.]
MTVSARLLFTFDNTFVRELEGLSLPWQAAPASAPRLLTLNAALARELGGDPAALATPEGVGLLTGTALPAEAMPVAQAYAGHQFGGYSPRLGDGRALLLGELIDVEGRRRDLHLKGSGRTPFARGGDGRAAVGPMLREYLVSEAMHALGIPTTRSLAVVATGDTVVRETLLPGAVLARVAASHLRVGTFQYAAASGDDALVRRLADYAIARHHPHAAEAENPYLAFLEAVVEAQAELIARWMLVGFVHGVMNTDNMTISGETIDYGPCAFVDGLDRATVFSSIDHGGRYAYGNQPQIALWNLTRLAETLLRLLADEPEPAREAATAVLATYGPRYHAHFERGLRAKIGLPQEGELDDEGLGEDLIGLMEQQHVDFTATFRALSAAARGDAEPARAQFLDVAPLDAWLARWQAQLGWSGCDPHEAATAMERVNPVYIPRNHLVEEALSAATAGEMEPLERLLDAVTRPFDQRPGFERHAAPAPAGFGDSFQTFCGT